MLTAALAILLSGFAAGTTVAGIIRAGDSGAPLAGAQIEAVGGSQRSWTDSTGHYSLPIPAGTVRLHVSRTGFEPRTIAITTSAGSTMRLDVTLERLPVRLGPVRVVGVRELPSGENGEAGRRRFTRRQWESQPFAGESDPLRILASSPDVLEAPESPSAVHVRGGGGDQNLVLLDGVPLYNADHLGGALSALNPDVVSSLTLHSGVPPARLGGVLSSFLVAHTVDPSPRRFAARGAADGVTVRQSIAGPLPERGTAFLVSARTSLQNPLLAGNHGGNGDASFGDVFAKAVMRRRAGELEMFTFVSRDHVGFDALTGTNGQPGNGGGNGGNGGVHEASAETAPQLGPNGESISQNRFGWTTATTALVWRSRPGHLAGVRARLWQTQFSSNDFWDGTAAAVHLRSSFRDVGGSAQGEWRIGSALTTAGASVERVGTRYGVLPAAGPAPTTPTVLAASPVLVSAFADTRWRLSDRWTAVTGFRADLAPARARALGPRLSMRFTPTRWLSLSGGYSRLYQPVQSLRNEESIVQGILGIAFPGAIGARGMPLGRSDQFAVAAAVRAGPTTTLSFDAYTRWMSGLALVAPQTGAPFALAPPLVGTGRAAGLALVVARRGRRFTGSASYGLARVSRTADATTYQPAFATSQTLHLVARYRLGGATAISAALQGEVGRPASLIADAIEWAPFSLFGGPGNLAGSPQRIAGPLDGQRLPPYMRVDLGIGHEWSFPRFGSGTALTATLAITNVFGRRNVLGTHLSTDGLARAIWMRPRSLRLGIGWTY